MKRFLKDFFGFNYYPTKKVATSLTVISWLAVVFLLFRMNSSFSWVPMKSFVLFFLQVAVIFATVILNQRKLVTTHGRLPFMILTIVLTLLLSTNARGNIFNVAFTAVFAISLACLISWKHSVMRLIYRNFFRLVSIASFITVLITLLSVLGLIGHIPYFTMPAQEALHEQLGFTYKVYGFIVVIVKPFGGDVFSRASGFLCEPGHFAILLSIFYVVERLQMHRPNLPILICGLLTFSPAFYVGLAFVEVTLMIKYRYFGKYMRWGIIFLVGGFVTYSVLPSNLREEVNYQLFGRNFASVLEAFTASNSIDNALDERINHAGKVKYEQFLKSDNQLFGTRFTEDNVTLSDYRGLLVQHGYIGALLVIIEIFLCVQGVKKYQKIPFLAILFLIFLHRSWMFFLMYHYILVFIGCNVVEIYNQRKRLAVAK